MIRVFAIQGDHLDPLFLGFSGLKGFALWFLMISSYRQKT